MKKSNKELLILAGALILAFIPWALRFWCDPDLTLTWSKGVFLTDELYHGGNALKAALSGRWLLSDYNYIFMDPLLPLIQRAVYAVFGVSLLAARLPAVLLNLTLSVLLVFMVYKYSPRRKLLSSLIAIFLISGNYYFFTYGRLALIDLPMAALGLASFLLYLKALQADYNLRISRLASAGMLLYLALLIKATAVNFILAYLFFVLFALALKQITKKASVYTLTMIFLAAVAQYATLRWVRFIFGAEHLTLRSDTLIRYKLPHDVWHLLQLYVTSLGNGFVWHNGALLLLVLIVLIMLLRRVRRGYKPLPADLLFASLFLSTFVFHGFFNYHPPRYYIILLIPIGWFVATIPWRLDDWEKTKGQGARVLTAALLLIVLADGWNLYRYAGCLLRPQFTFVKTAQALGRAIQNDAGSRSLEHCILYDADVHTSIPFYLPVDFEYGRDFSKALAGGKTVYFISSRPEKKYSFLGAFEIYQHFKLYLYRIHSR